MPCPDFETLDLEMSMRCSLRDLCLLHVSDLRIVSMKTLKKQMN